MQFRSNIYVKKGEALMRARAHASYINVSHGRRRRSLCDSESRGEGAKNALRFTCNCAENFYCRDQVGDYGPAVGLFMSGSESFVELISRENGIACVPQKVYFVYNLLIRLNKFVDLMGIA